MEDKKLNAGRVGLTMKGAWDASQSYEKLNCVSHNGRSWAAKKNVSAGVEPSAANSEFWQMMSDRGEQGIQGPAGPQGNSGYTGTANELLVVNDLTSGGATAALSAEQGKILNRQLYGMGIYITTFSVTAGVGHSSTIDRIPCFMKSGEAFYVYARLRNGAYITNINVTPSSSVNWQGIGNHKAYNPPSKWTAPFDVTEIGYYIDPTAITSSGDVDIVVIANPLAALL